MHYYGTYYRLFYKCLRTIKLLNIFSSPVRYVGVIIFSILQIRKLRHKEFMELCQDHTGRHVGVRI